MGNTISAEPHQKSESMETIPSVLEKLRSQVSIVDHAVTGLARAIDTLQLNCQLLEDKGEGLSGREEAGQVLQKLQDLILDNKCVTVKSVANFLTFVIELVKRFDVDQTVTNLPSLEVNNYCQESQNGIAQLDTFREYFIRRIDSLKLENKSLQSILDNKGEELRTLSTRLQTYIDENELLRKELNVEHIQEKINKNEEASYFEEIVHIQGQMNQFPLQKESEEYLKQNKLERKLNAELEEYQRKIETYKTENERLIKKERLLRSKDEEIATLKEAITKLETSISQSNNDCKSKISSNNGPMTINSDLSAEDLKEKMASLEHKYTLEKENRQRAEAELARLRPEYDSLFRSCRNKQRLEEEINAMEARLEELRSKKKVFVQSYTQQDFRALTPERNFFKRLTMELEHNNIELVVQQLNKPADALADTILIGSVSNPTGNKKRFVENFLKECTGATKKKAIVVYHTVSKNEDYAKFVAQFEKVYGSISTVFHVAQTGTELSSSDLNTSTVKKIVKFIVEECGAKSLLFESAV